MENLQDKNISANNFEQCIKCTVCTVYCPVVPVNPNYPGPKQAGPDGERLRLKRGEFFDEALKYCLNCKRCEVACPSNVKIGDIIQSARIKYSKDRFYGHIRHNGRSCDQFRARLEACEDGDGQCA